MFIPPAGAESQIQSLHKDPNYLWGWSFYKELLWTVPRVVVRYICIYYV